MLNKPASTGLSRTVLVLLDITFLCAVFLAPIIWLTERLAVAFGPFRASASWGWQPLVVPAVLLLLRSGFKGFTAAAGARGIWEAPLTRKITMALVSSFAFFLVLEAVLVAVDFESHMTPIVIVDETSTPAEGGKAIVADPELIWTFNPGVDFNGRIINDLGFADRQVDPVKRNGTVRVICMGGSCTAQGIPPYSGYLHRALTNDPPTGAAWEAFNTAVHGYSVAQGLRLFRNTVRQLEPDIVTVYFGWNDHWLEERPDTNRMALRAGPVAGRILSKLKRKRFFQLLTMIMRPSGSLSWRKGKRGYRVPPEEYELTLEQLVTEIRSDGAVPMLITAPRAKKLTNMIVRNGQAESREQAMQDHDRYVRITREVARRLDVPLLDLAADFTGEEHAPLFALDGIHFKRKGRIVIAAKIHGLLKEISAPEE